MSKLTLNLPVDIPWKLIAVSPDMMDVSFGDRHFPYRWRSSLALSAFEPNLADLPEELADQRITFLKVTATITGYTPTDEEAQLGRTIFPDVPTEDLERTFKEYWACYGAVIEVAVFPKTSPDGPVQYSISGQVTGGSSAQGTPNVSLSGLPGKPTTGAQGQYSGTVDAGWSGTVTPVLPDHTFQPPNRTYTNISADQPNQDYASGKGQYTISGKVMPSGEGEWLAGVSMNGLPWGPKTDEQGHYSATVPAGWSGTVTPMLPDYTFQPANSQYDNVRDDWANQDYRGTKSFVISGQVTANGVGLMGLYMDGLPGCVTDAQGHYACTVEAGWGGTVTPQLAGYTFQPPNRSYAYLGQDYPAQDYVTSKSGKKQCSISGQVTLSGAGLAGVTLGGLPGNPATDVQGNYTITVDAGWSGTVTPVLPGYSFQPPGRSYADVTVDQAQQAYAATRSRFSISGHVRAGAAGMSGITLSGLPGNPTTDQMGYYMSTVDAGWSGAVTPVCLGGYSVPSSRPYANVSADQDNQDYSVHQFEPTYFGSHATGTKLPNPYQSGRVSFGKPIRGAALTESSDPETNLNHIVSFFDRSALLLGEAMTATCPPTSRVRVKIAHEGDCVTTVEVYSGLRLLATRRTGSEPNQVHAIAVDGEKIDRVVFRTPAGQAALLDFDYRAEGDTETPLSDYPHIIDFEPKSRDLYQLASNTGEILTSSASRLNTGKSFTHGTKTDAGLNVGSGYDSGPTPYGDFKGDWRITRDWGESDQSTSTMQTDASRERRELQSATTQITQMYNLLTGYHLGTNRAMFLMLPRPHTLQATNYRTFQLGLRMIEGVQEFFLVVSRPRKMAGLAVEVLLETGHFSEKTQPASQPPAYKESTEDFHVSVYAAHGTVGGEIKNIQDDPSATYNLSSGWVVDCRPERQGTDPGHPGIQETANDSNQQANSSLEAYDYKPTSDAQVQVTGRINGSGWLLGPGAQFDRSYRVYTRSPDPIPPDPDPPVQVLALITSRGLSGAFLSGEGQINPVYDTSLTARSPQRGGTPATDGIVDERAVVIDPAVLQSNAQGNIGPAAAKEALRQMQLVMAGRGNRRTRRPAGAIGFLETEHFKNRIRRYLPNAFGQRPIKDIPDLPAAVVDRLGKDRSVSRVLDMDLTSLARTAGISLEDALDVRRRLLGLPRRP